MTAVEIIVPWRDKGDARRAANRDRVLKHLHDLDIAPVRVVSDGRTGSAPFNRSAAYQAAIEQHPADVWIFHEADMLIARRQLVDAVALAADTRGLVVPFTTYAYLSADDSRQVIDGEPPATFEPEWAMTDGRSIGAVGVVSAATMALVGQWDTTLEGHGYDDNAMFEAFRTAAGAPAWITGTGWHLWHPPAYSPWAGDEARDHDPAEVAATRNNQARLRKYRQATTPEQIRHLTGGGQ